MKTNSLGARAARFLSSTAPVLAATLLIFGLVPGAAEAGLITSVNGTDAVSSNSPDFTNLPTNDDLQITVNPGAQAFTFRNPDATKTATDFRVVLATLPPPPAIGGGTGGAPFPNTSLELPAAGGGFLRVVYSGGAGIPPGGQYTHSFPGWPAQTMFNVTFSYAVGALQDPTVVNQGNFTTQGLTFPVPEPASLTLVGLGLSGVLGYAGWRRGCRGTPRSSAYFAQ